MTRILTSIKNTNLMINLFARRRVDPELLANYPLMGTIRLGINRVPYFQEVLFIQQVH